MLDFNLPLTTSRNVIGEIRGSESPDEVVIVSGHVDSWDVGQGAMDDGGGCFISVEALNLLNSLSLRPKRTLRAILWTAEEIGLNYWGSFEYDRHHKGEVGQIVAAFESDGGTFTPKGLDFAGSEEAGCIVNEILKLLAPLNATEYNMFDYVSTDIYYMQEQGVPGLRLNNADDNYFWYHHSEADTITMMDSAQLDQGTAVWVRKIYL
jgi:carboxypeptidase Q